MRNVMQIGEDFLDRAMRDFCSEEVEYRAGGVSRGKCVQASIGKTFFKVNDISGYVTRVTSVDFFIDACKLSEEPKKGDIIARGNSIYEVFAPDNESCWKWSGTNEKVYRIHTMSIGKDEYYPLEV